MLTPQQVDRYRARRVPRRRGLRRARCVRGAAATGASRSSTACEPTAERTVFTTDQQERTSNREFLSSGGVDLVLLRGGCVRRRTASCARTKELSINKIGHAMHDLDPVFESFSYTPELAEVAADIGLDDTAGAAEHVHLQAAAHRRRGRLPPGRHVPLHRPDERHRVLVRHRGRHARQRLPVGRAGRAPRPAAPACSSAPAPATTTAPGSSPLDDTPLPDAARRASCRSRPRPARWSCCTACCPTGATSTARRRAATRTACTASSGAARLPGDGTGCSGRPSMPLAGHSHRIAAALMTAVVETSAAGAQGAAPRPPRRRPAPGDRRRAGQRVRLPRPADHRRRRARPRGSTGAPSATTSCSTSRRSPTPSA